MSTMADEQLARAFSQEDHELIKALYALSKKSPKLVKSTEYDAPADPSIKIRSWKMNEFKYYDIPSPFPTLARGLFTQEIKQGDQVKYRIVVRGYDKFFNIGEVPWNTWASLEAHTKPPYVLTLKSNGCIIFISALSPTKLIVTSKHSVGSRQEVNESHAQVGERWLRKHLSVVGKTEEQLATELWNNSWTAVAELCDDSFEEHVLPISTEMTGLHLHGINQNSKHFQTLLQDKVDAFAKEWGFIPTASTVLKTIPQVKEFTEEIGRTGKWRGQALEGFVVRCHVSSNPPSKGAIASPYEPGSSFFFKVKFDEPYMMYRDWREVTKTLLSKGPSTSNVTKNKLRRAETRAYVKWVISEIKRDKKQFSEFTNGKGIIATRERFLKWLETEQGRKELEKSGEEAQSESKKGEQYGKTIIVPVAVPGVGKTTIAVALVHLFGFGHTQSDDVRAKKTGPQFIKNVVSLLKNHDVVIADKNNHLITHRKALRDATRTFQPPVRLMALNWTFDIPISTVHRICGDRVLARGSNHQSLRAGAATKDHEEVIWMFLKDAQELTEDEIDVSVEMNVQDSFEDSLARAVDACVRILGVPRPSQEKMGEALAKARGYIAKERMEHKKKEPKFRYYALLPEINLEVLLEKRVEEEDVTPEGRSFFKRLVANNRVADRPHVTIVHEKGLPGDQDLWDRCKQLHEMASPPLFSFRLSHLVWDDRVMAIFVCDLTVSTQEEDSEAEVEGLGFVAKLQEQLKDKFHITVGTRDVEIPPVEARDLVARWKEAEKGIESCQLKDVWVQGRVRGLYK